MQQRAFCVTFIALSIVGGQPCSASELPYAENQRHTLSCDGDRDARLTCLWYVQGDDGGAFHSVTVGTEFVKMGSLPGDLDVYLNDATKGTYRCSCRMPGEQSVRKKVFAFYSAGEFGHGLGIHWKKCVPSLGQVICLS